MRFYIGFFDLQPSFYSFRHYPTDMTRCIHLLSAAAILFGVSSAWMDNAIFLVENGGFEGVLKQVRDGLNQPDFDLDGLKTRFEEMSGEMIPMIEKTVLLEKLQEFEESVKAKFTENNHLNSVSDSHTILDRSRRNATDYAQSYEDCINNCNSDAQTCETTCRESAYSECYQTCIDSGDLTGNQCTNQCAPITSTTTVSTTTVSTAPTTLSPSQICINSCLATQSNTTLTDCESQCADQVTPTPKDRHDGFWLLLILFVIYEIISHGSSDSSTGNLGVDLGLLVFVTFLVRKIL